MAKHGSSLAIVVALLVAAPVQAWETPGTAPVSDLVPADARQGPGWKLAPEVREDGFAAHFTLRTDQFGSFPVTGAALLATRVNEVRALRSLAEIKSSSAYGTALARAGKAPVDLAKNLINEPVDTVAAIPKGIGRAAQKAGRWLGGDRRERADTENSATREALGWSRRKRELAARLEVDPYSSNTVLQEALDRVAWSSFAGGMTLSAAFMAVGVPPVVDVTYKASNLQRTTQELVTSVSGGDLHRRNRQSLQNLGIPADRVEEFLNNPNLSPTQKTEITLALEGMAGARGLGEFVETGVGVTDPDGALRLVGAAGLAREFHENVSPVAHVARPGGVLLLLAESGALVWAAPSDRLLWTPDTEKVAVALRDFEPPDGGVRRREIRVSGTVSSAARLALSERGIETRERVGAATSGGD